jgi:hypothetical protein
VSGFRGVDPLNLVATMVCENGVRWGDQATDWQWADMKALLSRDRPNYHMWLRPRGGSKTWDAGAATIAVMLTRAGQGDEMYAAAANEKQAKLLAVKIAAITRNTPSLAGMVEVQQDKVLTPSTGAVLEVLSSETAGAWGKTPLWLFIDEMCNHASDASSEAFVTALLTSLPKRDCTCLIGSTPSWTGHWSYRRWERVLASAKKRGLWRPSHMPGPAPWQDPEELEEQQEDLLEYEYRRLFLCEWAAADDVVADDEALKACTREEPQVLEPDPSVQYVVSWDVGWKQDHSAVVVAHMGERAGRKAVICDSLRSWVPSKNDEVRIAEVMAHAARMSREYGGAPMRGDPAGAYTHMQDLREQGYDILSAETTANANSVRAKHLLRLLRDRALEIPPDGQLRREILSLRLAESTTPGIVRLTTDGSAKGHFDRVTALSYAVGELLARPGFSWRDWNGKLRDCQNCKRPYMARRADCSYCGAPNPDAPQKAPLAASQAVSPLGGTPGGYLAALAPPGAVRCAEDHIYPGDQPACPRCQRSAGTGSQLPAAFARALAIGRR